MDTRVRELYLHCHHSRSRHAERDRMLPEDQLLQGRCSSAVATECCCILVLPVSVSCWSWLMLGQSNGNVLPICSKVRKHACREMNLVCIMVLFKVALNILMYLLIHITLPRYLLLRWRRTALSLESVLALQISCPLSSHSTSLRVDWNSESDSCHLPPVRCFFLHV